MPSSPPSPFSSESDHPPSIDAFSLCAGGCGTPVTIYHGFPSHSLVVGFFCGKECQRRAWLTYKEASTFTSATSQQQKQQQHEETLCAADGCTSPGTLRCPTCLNVFYCGQECQARAWPTHRTPCKAAASVLAEQSLEKEKFEGYQRDAAMGNVSAQYNLGQCYFYGTGVAVDQHAAVIWWTKAAKAGDAMAQFNVGNCYENGIDVAVDKAEAVKWWRLSAEAGSVAAQSNLGFCYWNGEGITIDKKEAAKWYTRAAKAGDTDAQFNLGICYANGDGVIRDKREAVRWWTRAAEKGHTQAKYNLAHSR
jgi:hypothetical protein